MKILKINAQNGFKPLKISFKSGIKVGRSSSGDVVEIFKDLAKIPSPPLKEMNVANWIIDFCKKNEIL